MKKIKYFHLIPIALLLLTITIILVLYAYNRDKNVYKIQEKYFEGNVFSANEAANMIDSFDTTKNVIISPLNINSSLSYLYSVSDNKTKKKLEYHFQNSPNDTTLIINEKLTNLNTKKMENEEYYLLYNQLITEYFDKKYDEYTLDELKKLNDNSKSKLLTLLKKLDFLYKKIYKHEDISYTTIKKYKATKDDLKITNSNLLLMIKNITQHHEILSVTNEVKNYSRLYLNNFNLTTEKQTNTSTNIINVDFSETENLIKQINKDIKDFSNNNISYYLDEDILKYNNSLYINSLYFNYTWQNNYNSSALMDSVFYLENGEENITRYMYSKETIYLENEYAKGFKKDFYYKKYSFIGILPKSKGNFSLSSLNLDNLLANEKSNTDCLVAIPEISITYEADLMPVLNSLDLLEIALPKANYSKLTKDLTNLNYYKQKINLTISTNGTFSNHQKESKLETFSIDSASKEVILNRPFAFLIINNETKDILYIGKISEL